MGRDISNSTLASDLPLPAHTWNHSPRISPYTTLDAWRGAAALWVLMGHSCIPYISGGHLDLLRNPLFAASVWCQLGVVMFFVISGYCISGAAYNCIAGGKSLTRYAADRARRIYPPYLAACVAALALGSLTMFLQNRHVLPASNSSHPLPPKDLSFWLSNATLTQAVIKQQSLLLVAWSLCYEVAFYVIIGIYIALATLLSDFGLPKRIQFLFYSCAITTIASLIWLQIAPQHVVFPFDRWYQFGFGALLFGLFTSREWRSGAVGMNICASICVILSVTYACYFASNHGDLAHPAPRIQTITCLIFFFVLLLLRPINQRLIDNKLMMPFIWLGTVSYSIYLVHTFIICFPDAGLRRVGFVGSKYIINYVVQILTGVAGGWLFFSLVERHFISARQARRIEAELAHQEEGQVQ